MLENTPSKGPQITKFSSQYLREFRDITFRAVNLVLLLTLDAKMGMSVVQIVTLAATVELFVIAAALPSNDARYLPPTGIVAAIFGVHYGMLFFFNLAIYPVFFDPLRHVPGPRV